jgi:hypothetical protein
MFNLKHGTMIAIAAGSLFAAACGGKSNNAGSTTPTGTTEQAASGGEGEKTAKVHCTGVNECKGKGACAMPNGNTCAGKNECKGKGVIDMTADECTAKGGTAVPGAGM